MIAKKVAINVDIPFLSLAKKVKHTKSQVSLSRKQRWKNTSKVFQSCCQLDNETIIIVDDITTTGATLHHMASAIKKQHPDVRIWGAVFARNG